MRDKQIMESVKGESLRKFYIMSFQSANGCVALANSSLVISTSSAMGISLVTPGDLLAKRLGIINNVPFESSSINSYSKDISSKIYLFLLG